ncbi:MAG: hypothetical protein QXE51_02735 [Nitrososphaeria archaeon]
MRNIEEIRKEANSKTLWIPKVGEEIAVKVIGIVDGMYGSQYSCLTPKGKQILIPMWGYLKNKIEVNKYYYLECAKITVLTKGLGKGKLSRIFNVLELTQEEFQDFEKVE